MLRKLFTPHFRRFLVHSSPWLIVAIIGLVLAITSAYSAYGVWAYQPLMLVPENHLTSNPLATSEAALKMNTAEISGAVVKPGIYQVSEGSRWQEVVLMANGFLDSADRRYVHQKINLAEKVKDQAKLYVPFTQETAITREMDTPPQDTQGRTLFVNTTSSAVWDEIEGIGEARAAKILSGMPYANKNDFIARSGVSPAIYKSMEGKYAEIVY